MCRTQQSLLEARAAAEAAAEERRAVLQQARGADGAGAAAAADRGSEGGSRKAAGSGRGGRGGGAPAWRQHSREKQLGRQAEATLEMIYSRTQVHRLVGWARVGMPL